MVYFPTGFCLLLKRLVSAAPLWIHRRRLCGVRGENSVLQGQDITERYAHCLKTCTDIRSLRKLHAHIFIHGLGNNIYLGTKMLTSYANFGGLPESRWVFHNIINRNLSLWNSAIVGYFRAGYFEEVLRLYLNLKSEGIGLDSSTITFGLKSCTQLRNVELGIGVHADAFKFGLHDDAYVGSSLVGLYFGFGNVKDAREAFEDIMMKDVVAYTAMITGYAQITGPHAWKSFEIASNLSKEGLEASRVTLVSLLQAAAQSEALKEGRSIHCYALRKGIGILDEVFQTSLVDMYARCSAYASAASIINHMGRRSVASWNAMISGFTHSGQSFEALKCFSLMVQENLAPDSLTLANVLSACFNLKFTQYTTSTHAYLIKRSIPLDTVLVTALIQLYSECNLLKRGRELFDHMVCRDTILYNVMISGYLQNEEVDEAIKLLAAMMEEGIRPNSATALILLSAFCVTVDQRKGRWAHGFAIRYDLQSDLGVSNQILHMYSKCGHINTARTIFHSIADKDLISWTVMMMGYVNFGHADEVIRLFRQMLCSGQKPDSPTIAILLQALAQLGCLELVKEIHGYVYRMWLGRDTATMNSLMITYAKCGSLDATEAIFKSLIERELASWNTMIAAYGIHGCCTKALELFNQMQRENLMPNELTFTSVLSACSHSGLLDDGWRIFNCMRSEYSITPQQEHYCCMVDLLGRAGQLEEAYNLVKCSPLIDKTTAMCSLLAACKVHKNTKLAQTISEELLYSNSQNSGTYTLVSNLYAQDAKWSEVAKLRNRIRGKGLRKLPGYSLVESC